MARETIYDAKAPDFARQLVGRKIQSINTEAIVLDDGTVLTMESTQDCCAHFGVVGAEVSGHIADNVVTAVEESSIPGDTDEYSEAFRIVVLSEATELAHIDIDGTASSGYYCHSINLEVRRG